MENIVDSELGEILKCGLAHVRYAHLVAAERVNKRTSETEAKALMSRVHVTTELKHSTDRPKLVEFLKNNDGWEGKLGVRGERHELAELYRDLVNVIGPNNGVVAHVAHLRERVAHRRGPVLLEGATGTGKTQLARGLWSMLSQKSGTTPPFVIVNCSAVRPDDLESRMRGVDSGYYTGTISRKGWFEQAHKGVLVLDEFQETTPAFQAQFLDLLSATSDRVEVSRLGSEEKRHPFTVRTIMVVNQPVQHLLAASRLRRDLLYRIRVRHCQPSLDDIMGDPSQKKADIHRWLSKLLAARAWVEVADHEENAGARLTLSSEAAELLSARSWPGNYRELERILADAGLLAASKRRHEVDAQIIRSVQEGHAPPPTTPTHAAMARDSAPLASVQSLAAQAMCTALRDNDFHLGRAAQACACLGMRSQRKFVSMLFELRAYLADDIRNHPKVSSRIQEAHRTMGEEASTQGESQGPMRRENL